LKNECGEKLGKALSELKNLTNLSIGLEMNEV
jgi:hypothetical protein